MHGYFETEQQTFISRKATQDAMDYIRKEDAHGRFVPSSLNCIVLILWLLCMHLHLRIYERELTKKFNRGSR